MNNYCTKCGKKLDKEELECKKCATPIIDLPPDYKFPKSQKNYIIYYVIITIGICILGFITFQIIKTIVYHNKIDKLEHEYVEPYLKQNYNEYTIEYNKSDKCITSGSCHLDPVDRLTGECETNEYLDEKECTSYYYSIITEDEEFTLTVFNKDNKYSIVKGKNINFSEELNNKLITNYINPYLNQKYEDYSVEFESIGKCIISGDCYWGEGCDGVCEDYEYLDKNECLSYYYSVSTQEDDFTLTVFNKDGKYSIVEGININGSKSEYNEESDDSYNNYDKE